MPYQAPGLTAAAVGVCRPGRPVRVDNKDALRAAEIIKKGKRGQVEVNVNGQAVLVGITEYYRSVQQAYAESAEIRQICDRNACNCEQLLAAMHRVDPHLVRRALRIKHDLTFEQKLNRQRAARWLKAKLRNEPDFLDRVVFIDEATIYLVGHMDNKALMVWCDQNDKQIHDVIHCPGLPKDKKIKLHFIAAVCKKYGPLYFNWTTGSKFDGFERMPWKASPGSTLPPQQQVHSFPDHYTVSCWGCQCDSFCNSYTGLGEYTVVPYGPGYISVPAGSAACMAWVYFRS